MDVVGEVETALSVCADLHLLTLLLPVDVDAYFCVFADGSLFTTSYWFGVRTPFEMELLRPYSLEIPDRLCVAGLQLFERRVDKHG